MVRLKIKSINDSLSFPTKQEKAKASNLLQKSGISSANINSLISNFSSAFYSLGPLQQIKVIQALNGVNKSKFDEGCLIELDSTSDEEENVFRPFTHIRFKNENNAKQLYLYINYLESSRNVLISLRLTLLELDAFESNIGRGITKFKVQDDRALIEYLQQIDDVDTVRLRQYVYHIRKFCTFYSEQVMITPSSSDRLHADRLFLESATASTTRANFGVNFDSLRQASQLVDNPQYSVVPLLLYEGVKSSNDPAKSEILNLKQSDLKGNKLHISGTRERVIELSDYTVQVVKDAIRQDVTMMVNNTLHFIDYRRLVDAGMILKTTDTGRGRSLTKSGLRSRIRIFQQGLSQVTAVPEKELPPSFFSRI